MENKNFIQKGDLVAVNFNNSQYTLCSKATVLYVPICQGDCWIFQDGKDQIHYVSEGCTVSTIENHE